MVVLAQNVKMVDSLVATAEPCVKDGPERDLPNAPTDFLDQSLSNETLSFKLKPPREPKECPEESEQDISEPICGTGAAQTRRTVGQRAARWCWPKRARR